MEDMEEVVMEVAVENIVSSDVEKFIEMPNLSSTVTSIVMMLMKFLIVIYL